MPDFPAAPLSDHAEEVLERATADRAYRLNDDETPAAGVHRVALGRVDSALGHLQGDGGAVSAEAIHETRKDLKKLRSVLRLVRGPLGRKTFRRENDRYRQAARALGGARDAEVRLDTLAGLHERYEGKLPPTQALETRLAAARDAAGSQADDTIWARGELEAGAAALEALELGDERGYELLAAGLERSYRRGRKAMRVAAKRRDPVSVHAWRKRVKDLWYHLRLIREAWPGALEGTGSEAHALADLLGDHHDLAVLQDALDPASADERGLVVWIEDRQGELLDEALPLGQRLYAEKPKQFAGRIGHYWKAWRPVPR